VGPQHIFAFTPDPNPAKVVGMKIISPSLPAAFSSASRKAVVFLVLLSCLILAFLARGEDGDGFVPMFNGKDLSGWKTAGNWVVVDANTIALEPRPGEQGWKRFNDYIMTEKTYGNFLLDLEFKIEAKGNSGVFMRVANPLDPVETGMELQILDTHGKANPGHHDCGGIIRTTGPSKNMAKPAGEWNRYQISLIDHQLKVSLNGEQIVDIDLSTSAMKDRPAVGHIGFQDEAKPVLYRNVRIKELP